MSLKWQLVLRNLELIIFSEERMSSLLKVQNIEFCELQNWRLKVL